MSLKLTPDPERQEYILITGEIIFHGKEDPTLNVMRLNTVVTTKDPRISVAHIGRAQQGLQMEFHRRMQQPELEVKDVIILNIVRLGHFTHEEFNAPPEGMKLQERTEAAGNA